MGIRFYCPNGHKLNVKEFQAGRRGICPYCGAKIQIPTQSTRPSGRDEPPAHSDIGDGTEQMLVTQPDGVAAYGSTAASTPAATWPATPTMPERSGGFTSAPAPAYAPMEAAPQSPAGAPVYDAAPTALGGAPVDLGTTAYQSSPAAPASYAAAPAAAFASAPAAPASGAPPMAGAAPDPLAEGGAVVWYVRPASGGQYGPATSDVMRGWLTEGRVPADSLVWREGWRDWQQAAEVFPQLRPGSAPSIATDIAPTSSRTAARPQSRGMQTGIIVILVLAVIVLIAVFVWVLMSGGGETPSSKRPNAERVSQLEVLRPTEAPGTTDSYFRT